MFYFRNIQGFVTHVMEIGGSIAASGISLASLSAMEHKCVGAKKKKLPWESMAITSFKISLLFEAGEIINFYTTKITTYTVFFQ